MKLDYLKNNHSKNNKDIVSFGLLGISAFMGVLILIKVTGFFAILPNPKRLRTS
jgi:hypothetical protein